MDLLAHCAELRALDELSAEEEEILTKGTLCQEWLEANHAQSTAFGVEELQRKAPLALYAIESLFKKPS